MPAATATPSPRLPAWLRRTLLQLGGLAATYALLAAAIWWGQERLLFKPEVLAPDHRFALAVDVHETWIDVPGARLNALHLRLPRPRGVVFFLHGNAGNLQSWFAAADFYRRANFDLFMLDYRGYGKSSGHIQSQDQLQADVRAAWAAVAPRYAGLPRVIYGRSLGSGLAAALAAEVQPELTVLVSPFENLAAVASLHYPWLPMSLLRYPLRTDAVLPRIRGPVWIAHGEHDRLIPLQQAEHLQALSPRVSLLRVPGVGHADIQRSAVYLQGLREVLAAVMK